MTVYLDHNATTPLRPEVFEAMRPLMEGDPAANASSTHRPGQRARLAVELAREEVAKLVGCEPPEVIFTSGGTEADNLALLGFVGSRLRAGDPRAAQGPPHVVSTAIEHPAVEECLALLEADGVVVTRVAPDRKGAVVARAVEQALRPETVLVSVMLANNETGALQPVAEIARIARQRGIVVHTDAVQAVGRIPVDILDLGVGLLSISAHKMGGPQGVGALIVRRGFDLSPRQLGGPQERRRRSGTEPAALIRGFGEAARLSREEMGSWERLTGPLRDRFETEAAGRFPGIRWHRADARLPNTTSLALPGRSGEAIVMALDLDGIAISTGSACSSGATVPSRVLRGMGLDDAEVRGTIRISFGPGNREQDVPRLLDALGRVLERGGALPPDRDWSSRARGGEACAGPSGTGDREETAGRAR